MRRVVPVLVAALAIAAGLPVLEGRTGQSVPVVDVVDEVTVALAAACASATALFSVAPSVGRGRRRRRRGGDVDGVGGFGHGWVGVEARDGWQIGGSGHLGRVGGGKPPRCDHILEVRWINKSSGLLEKRERLYGQCFYIYCDLLISRTAWTYSCTSVYTSQLSKTQDSRLKTRDRKGKQIAIPYLSSYVVVLLPPLHCAELVLFFSNASLSLSGNFGHEPK